MNLQRKLLRAMLVLLALAALAGVTTIFVQATDLLGRIALTLTAAAIAAALALPASSRLEHERTRRFGLAALGAIVPAFVLILIAIWIGLFGFSRWEWNFAGTAGHFTICSAAGLFALGVARRAGGRVAGLVSLVATSLCLIFGLVGIWLGPLGLFTSYTLEEQCWETAWLVFCCGVMAGMCLYGLGVRSAPWRWIGVLASLAALGLGEWGIWNNLHDEPVWLLQAIFIAAAVGVCNVLNMLELRGFQRVVALGTMAMILTTFSIASYINVTSLGFRNADYEQDLSVRLLAAGSIVSVCGLLAIVIFLAANRRALVTSSGPIGEIKLVRIICPRCATKCDAAIGSSRCPGCGLLFLLQLAEPHCVKCEYNLLDLKGDRCPECGTPVAESLPRPPAA